LTLAPRSRRCWNSDHRKHGLHRFASPPVVLHPPTIGQDEITAFGGIHAASTPETDDEVGTQGAGRIDALLHVLSTRIFTNVTMDRDDKPGRLKKTLGPIHITCLHDSGITYDQNPTAS
jgi:hypothetical protein